MPFFLIWLLPLIIFDLILRAIALWRAGRNNHLGWFIALFIVNSVGILPAVYLLAFDMPEKKQKKRR